MGQDNLNVRCAAPCAVQAVSCTSEVSKILVYLAHWFIAQDVSVIAEWMKTLAFINLQAYCARLEQSRWTSETTQRKHDNGVRAHRHRSTPLALVYK